MKNWLESFALVNLPVHLLHHSQSIFRAAKNNKGRLYLLELAMDYAFEHDYQDPAYKSIGLDYTDRYEGFDALFIQVWPCLSLSKPPVYLAAIRKTDASVCRLFRLHYLGDKQLSLSEFDVYERAGGGLNLPSYEEATDLIFSYTLGTPCFRENVLSKEWELPALYAQDKVLVK